MRRRSQKGRKVGRALQIGVAMLSAGCTAHLPEDIGPIRAAWIETLILNEFSVLVGGMGGSGSVRVELETGGQRWLDIRWRGGTAGLGAEIDRGPLVFSVPFGLPDREVSSSDLLGWYTGSAAGLSVVAGIEVHHLRNNGIRLDLPTVPLGANLMIGFEWMVLDGDWISELADTGEL